MAKKKKGTRKRNDKVVNPVEGGAKGKDTRSKRTSIDQALGIKLRENEDNEKVGKKRHSVDILLSKGHAIDAEDIVASITKGEGSSDEEIEYFDAKNGGESPSTENKDKEQSKDDEFDYAFEGKPREGKTHKREYVATKAPGNIFMGKTDSGAIAEEEEIEEESQNEESPGTKVVRREKSIDMTADQWSAIINIQYEEEERDGDLMLAETVIYEEAVEALAPKLDPGYEMDAYEPSCLLNLQSCFAALCSQPEYVIRHKACILHLVEKKFENDNARHEVLLTSIYCTIYGKEAGNVKRYGKHWESIGFQGNDPSTDLRGTGLWGLLQILFFLEHCFNFAQAMFDYSHNANYGFPLCALALNITGIGIDLLNEGAFDTPSIDVGSMHKAMNFWYCGAMFVFFRTWKDSKATIEEAGTVLDLLKKQLLSKSTVRSVMQEGSELTESYMEDNFETEAQDREVEFSQF